MNARHLGREHLGRPSRFKPGIVKALLASYLCLSAPSIHAAPEDTKAQCLAAYADGQRARKAGAFLKATEAFSFCGGASCPQALHGDCLRWLDEVQTATPTSVFRVRNTSGDLLRGAEVSVDRGAKQKLEGRALAFDPGEHSLTFELLGYHPVERRFTFTEGEKLVAREVELAPLTGSPQAADTDTGVTDETDSDGASEGKNLLPVWIGTGVGVVGLAGFAYFAVNARADDLALSGCFPNCPVAQVDEVRQGYEYGHISLAAGALGLVAAATWLFLGPEGEASSPSTSVGNLQIYVGPKTGITGRF